MKIFLCRTKPDNGRLFISGVKPEKRVLENGEVHWTFSRAPVQTDLTAMNGLGIYSDRIPGPGEYTEVTIPTAPKTIEEVIGG